MAKSISNVIGSSEKYAISDLKTLNISIMGYHFLPIVCKLNVEWYWVLLKAGVKAQGIKSEILPWRYVLDVTVLCDDNMLLLKSSTSNNF